MGKPDLDLPPEPERPWPIDPRPATKELKQMWDGRPTLLEQSSQSRRWTAFLVFAGLVFLVWSSWSNRVLHLQILPPYVSREKLSQIEKGMSQKEVREILGEPPGKSPDCWSYNFRAGFKTCLLATLSRKTRGKLLLDSGNQGFETSSSDEQYVNVHFGSMFKVTEVERVKKRLRDSER